MLYYVFHFFLLDQNVTCSLPRLISHQLLFPHIWGFFAPMNVIKFIKIFPRRLGGHSMLPCGLVWLHRHVLPYAAFVILFPSLYVEEKKLNKPSNKKNGPNAPEGNWPQKGIPLKNWLVLGYSAKDATNKLFFWFKMRHKCWRPSTTKFLDCTASSGCTAK